MYRGLKKYRDYSNNDSVGFKFSLTIIVSATTLLITLLSYVNNNAQPFEFALIYFSIISCCIILIASFLLYIFLEGLSFEAPFESKNKIKKIASKVYIANFYFVTISFPFIAFLLFFATFKTLGENTLFIGFAGLILFVIVGFFHFKISPIKFPIWAAYIIIIVIFGLWLSITAITIVLSEYDKPIDIDAKDVYYYDVIIPINIIINGGINDNISISLMQERFNNSLQEIDSLHILSYSYNQTFHGERMFGTSDYHGKYSIYIKTHNLTTGYYELIVSKEEWGVLDSKKGFYFINNNSNNTFISVNDRNHIIS